MVLDSPTVAPVDSIDDSSSSSQAVFIIRPKFDKSPFEGVAFPPFTASLIQSSLSFPFVPFLTKPSFLLSCRSHHAYPWVLFVISAALFIILSFADYFVSQWYHLHFAAPIVLIALCELAASSHGT
jgi:hypothetical protein